MSSSSTTLESSLFESNVSGRYGSWAEEQAEASFDSSRRSEDEEAGPCCEIEEEECQHQEQQQQQQQLQYDSYRPGPRTGPKGVLADHKAYQQAMQQLRGQEQAHRQAVLLRIARGSSSSSTTNSPPLPAINEEEDDSDSGDDNDAFMRSYRAQRLNDLQQQQQQQHPLLPCPCFGEVEEVSGSGMVDVVESLQISSPNTRIVVHIYENHLPACRLVNGFLPHLAAKHPLVRFLRLHQGCNLPRNDLKLDEEALPLLLVYEGGEVKECVARVDACLGVSFLCEDLEGLLEEKGVWG